MRWPKWLLNGLERVMPARGLVVVESEALPDALPSRDLVLLRDAGEDWCVAMRCPCGCKQRVELPLIPEARPRWSLRLERNRHPTLSPSVWLREGCKSHYFVSRGRVRWV